MTDLQRAENALKYLDPLQFKQPLMLDIGSGGLSKDDKFTSVDAFTEADINAMMWDIPLPDNSVVGIYSANALEHVSKYAILPTLREWNRLLVPEGRLQLIVPDFEWAAQWWLDHQWDLSWSLDIIFGHQSHDGEYHKTAFTPSILEMYFSQEESGTWGINKIEYIFGDQNIEDIGDGTYRHNVTQRAINVEAFKPAAIA